MNERYASKTPLRARLWLVAVLVGLTAFGGCGEEEKPASPAESARSTISDFLTALSEGDYEAVCESISPNVEDDLYSIADPDPLSDDPLPETCIDTAKAAAVAQSNAARLMGSGELDVDVSEDGELALVTYETRAGEEDFELEEQGDSWRIIGIAPLVGDE